MKNKLTIAIALIILTTVITFTGCANMRWGTNAGVDVRFGPNGVRLDPHVELDLYSGGRF
jgi:hypothetical protein